MALRVVRNEVDGWDVVREDQETALSNHPDRASAEAAAQIRAGQDRVSEEGDEPVVVAPNETHEIEDPQEGVKPVFLLLGALAAAITLLLIVLALTGALTGFGS